MRVIPVKKCERAVLASTSSGVCLFTPWFRPGFLSLHLCNDKMHHVLLRLHRPGTRIDVPPEHDASHPYSHLKSIGPSWSPVCWHCERD
jgi:hypothetical protein